MGTLERAAIYLLSNLFFVTYLNKQKNLKPTAHELSYCCSIFSAWAAGFCLHCSATHNTLPNKTLYFIVFHVQSCLVRSKPTTTFKTTKNKILTLLQTAL